MSTRSYVGYVTAEKAVAYVYNHSDSYLESLGKALYANDPEKVRQAINNDDIPLLWGEGSNGFKGNPYTTYSPSSFLDIPEHDISIEFCYLLDENNIWYVTSRHGVAGKVYLLSDLIGKNADPELQNSFLKIYYDDVVESMRNEWNSAMSYGEAAESTTF